MTFASLSRKATGLVLSMSVFTLIGTAASAQTSTSDQSVGGSSGGGEVRSANPRIMDANRPGYFEAGIGPSFSMGLGSDQALYDITAAYLYNFNDRLAGKVIGDFNFGSSADTTRSIDLGVGADYYLSDVVASYGVPYVMGDIGWGFVRNAVDRTVDAPAIGAGAGFKFAAQELNFDVNLHYEVLTAQLDSKTPSIVGLRAAVNF